MNEGMRKRIDETLQSLDNLQRAEANAYLYSKICNRIQERKGLIPQDIAWRMMLALLTISLVNLFTIRQLEAKKKDYNGAELVAKEYAIMLPTTY